MTAACPACAGAPAAIDAAEAPASHITLSVPGLKCAACIQTVERALNALPGVRDARVNLTLKRVSAEANVSADLLVDALKDAGFDAYPYDLDASGSAEDRIAKDMILRLGVAGFGMMNVMLLSVAVWSGATDATRDLFHLISAAIALPCTIFASRPFLASAWSALRVRRLNMDVPISLAIVLAAGMSLYEALNGGAHAYFDAALSLTFFLLIGRLLEHRTRASARSAAKDLAALEVRKARLASGDGYVDVDVASLCVDDVVQVATGMRVPVDGHLEEAHALTDRSFITGESDPVVSARGGFLRAGEINLGAPFHLKATAVGEDTNLRQNARLVETAETARNSYTSMADRAAQVYAPAVHLLALVTFLGWYVATGDLRHALNIAIAVLIITCPCALGLAVPAVATAAIGRLYSMGFLVKSGTALERLAEADTVVFDKTGTLTEPGVSFDFDGLDADALRIAKTLAAHSQHPMSRAVFEALPKVTTVAVTDIREHSGLGVEGSYGGARVALGRASWLGAKGDDLTLMIGKARYPISSAEVLRLGAKDLSQDLLSHGITPQIISGDTEAKTLALAETLGISAWEAGVTPQRKHALVEETEASGHHVVMFGDGINDTPALAAAHASVAPGTALDAARNAADVVLLRKSLCDVPKLFEIARMTVRLSRENFAIATAYNAIAIPIAVAGFATPMLAAIAMSVSSLTVLANALRVRRV